MSRDHYCDAQTHGIPPGKLLVLNRPKWQSIIKHLNRDEDIQIMSDYEIQHREYLRQASKAMTSQWENSVEKIRSRKDAEKVQREKNIVASGERLWQELKENDNRIRMEHLQHAKNLLKKNKSGPRQLETAAILGEVLKGREIQRNINYEKNQLIKKRELEEGREIIEQSKQWLIEQKEKMIMDKKRTYDYKQDLYKYIKSNEQKQMEKDKRRLDMEKEQREMADRELQAQIGKEKFILQQKKEAMRRNALEAMRMAEQRRLRDKMEDEIENKIVDICAKGKQNINNIKKQKEREIAEEKDKIHDFISNRIAAKLKQSNDAEDERKRLEEIELNEKLDKREFDKIEYNKKMKAARIKQHLEEIERAKKLKEYKLDEMRWDVANRLKNVEVNNDFANQQKKKHLDQIQETRQVLNHQINNKTINDKINRDNDLLFMNPDIEEDDANFFEYADILIKDAKAKGRPILPLVRAVDKYRKNNYLKSPKGELPHLKSNIPMCDNHNNAPVQPCKKHSSSTTSFKYEVNQLKNLNPYN